MDQSNEHKRLLNVLSNGVQKYRQDKSLNDFAVAMADDILETIRRGCFDKIVIEDLPEGATEVRLCCSGFFNEFFAEYDKVGNVTRLGVSHVDNDSPIELINEYEELGVL